MNDTTTPATDAEILPVGMLANGRGPTQEAMENIAMRKNGIEGWEPFHYEKISATEFEVTGGIPAVIGGAKKWLEPHTTVLVSEEEIAQELAADTVGEAPQDKDEIGAAVTIGAAQSTLSVPEPRSLENSDSTPKYMTVVLRMPTDKAGHQRIADTLGLNKNFFGAVVMATAFQDEILVSESLQKN